MPTAPRAGPPRAGTPRAGPPTSRSAVGVGRLPASPPRATASLLAGAEPTPRRRRDRRSPPPPSRLPDAGEADTSRRRIQVVDVEGLVGDEEEGAVAVVGGAVLH